jgi:KDO2-lipid IV(A) lauroyltransferase
MARPRNKFADYATYLAARLGTMFVHMAGPGHTYRAARGLGWLAWKLSARHRHRATEHVRRSFPDWPPERVESVARESMVSLVKMGAELLLSPRLITPTRWRRHIRLADMQQCLRMLVERRRGVIFVTGHFGNWEVVGYTMATLGFAGYAVARPLDNPYLNRYVLGVRQRNGLTILDKAGASAQMDDILARGDYVSFIADQDAGRRGLFVDFFGRQASTFKSIALMAMSHEVPVVVGFGRRIGEDFTFEIGIERVIEPEEWAHRDDAMQWITQQYTSALERIVRRSPEQYLWAHRRWKHRPKGEPDAPGGIA